MAWQERKKNVYIPHDADHDYSDVERFGEPIIITAGPVDRYNIPRLMQTFKHRMAAAQEGDFIVANGLPVLVGIASSIMAARFGKVRYLQWNKRGYWESTVLLTDIHPSFSAGPTEAVDYLQLLNALVKDDAFASDYPHIYDQIKENLEAMVDLGAQKLG